MRHLNPVTPQGFAPGAGEADIDSAAPPSTIRLVSYVCASLVVMTVLCSRLGLPLGAKQVPLTLPVAIVHLIAIALLSGGRVSIPRFLATAGVVAVILFETMLVHRHTSMMSVLYVVAIYLPLVINTGLDGDGLRRVWRVFIGLAMIGAILGIMQIAVQTVAGGYYLDPFDLLPERLQLQGYSITYPIMRGVLPTLKANGMLFVEPSAFSQFLALAVLGELWLFRRWRVLALLAGGMTLSFSGTGLMMIAGGLILGANARAILGLLATTAAVAVILVMTGYGEAFTSRAGELQRPGTSGYERFVAPFVAMGLPFGDSVDAVVWGYGAGRVEDLDTEYSANYSPIPKVFLEYGVVGMIAFTLLWLAMFRGLAVQRPIVGAMAVMYFLAAGSLLQPYTVFALWGLSGGFAKRTSVDDVDPAYPEADHTRHLPLHSA